MPVKPDADTLMHITTPSCHLRPWSAGDIDSLVQSADNPRIAAGMRDGFPHPYTREDAKRFIASVARSPNNFFLAIEVGGRAAGGIGVHILDDVYRKTGEIGYWLAEPLWGRGITTDAVRALVPAIFARTDLVRIQAGIFASNPASGRILEKCGFVREAVHKNAVTKNGILMDEYLYVFFRSGDEGSYRE